jgi:hypothetical protein
MATTMGLPQLSKLAATTTTLLPQECGYYHNDKFK